MIVLIGAILLALDMLTKYLSYAYLQNAPLIFTRFLKVRYSLNKGFAFSSLENLGSNNQSLFIALVSLVIIIFLFHSFYRFKKKHDVTPEGLILIGAIGNLWSRLFFNGVIDFIEISFFGINSSIFNLADIYIVLGLIFIMIRINNEPA